MTKIVQKKSDEVTSNEAKTVKHEKMSLKFVMKNLLVSNDETIEDKIVTVKTAQMVDQGRFENV